MQRALRNVTPIFWTATLTHEVDQTDLVFAVRSEFTVGLCTQDYKSLCASVTICGTVINIQRDTHTDTL